MKAVTKQAVTLIAVGCLTLSGLAQSPPAAGSVVPSLIRFSGAVTDVQRKPLIGLAGLTFAIYQNQSGGAPLWLETQNVSLDANGRYIVYLGSNHPAGVPPELFASGEARWLGVQPEGQPEQARVLLVSVPYAMKAADADTLGGLPASSYVTADQLNQSQSAVPAAGHGAPALDSSRPVTPGPCTSMTSDGAALANYLTKFTSPCNIENSGLYQSALATTPGFIGIGTTAPQAPLDLQPAAQSGTTGDLYDEHIIANFNPSANSTANYYAFYGQSNSSTGNATNFMGDIVGSGFIAQHYGTGTAANVFGANYTTQNRSTGTITNAVGFFAEVGNLGSGTISNGYGLWVPVPQNSGGGVFTNFYGVYISNPTGITNSWGLYSLANTNYMSGKLGIGVTAPTQALEINGNLKLDTIGHGITYPDGSVQTTASVAGTGTITGVTAGTDLTGGGTSGKVTVNLDTTKVPTLAASNVFMMTQQVLVPAVSSGPGAPAIAAAGGNTSATSQPGGEAIYALGGSNTSGDVTSTGGYGIVAIGGTATTGQYPGAGILAQGGAVAPNGNGATGLQATGSNGDPVVGNGGNGIVATGGNAGGASPAGYGIQAMGGTGGSAASGIGGGTGGYFMGGDGGSGGQSGGVGIVALPGVDVHGNPNVAGLFTGQIHVVSYVGITQPQAYLEQGVTTDYSRLRFLVDMAAEPWDIAVGGGSQPVMNFYRSDIGNAMSLTPGGSQYMLMGNGALLTTGGVWTNNSDRNLKENFTAINGADLLARLQAVPMSSWKYKSETGVRHLGPMAQDFYAAFGLGDDDKHISTVDEGGVALAAIQELYRQGLEKDAEIRRQRKREGEQQKRIEALSRQVAELNRAQSAVAALESRLTRLEADQHAVAAALPNRKGRANNQAPAPTLAKAPLRSE